MKRTPLVRKTPLKRGPKPLARSRLNPVSKDPKKRRENAAYESAKRKWRKGHDGRCEMRWVDGEPRAINEAGLMFRCHNPADNNPHHAALRGPNLCKINTFLGLCTACHRWVHEHAREARRLGYLK